MDYVKNDSRFLLAWTKMKQKFKTSF